MITSVGSEDLQKIFLAYRMTEIIIIFWGANQIVTIFNFIIIIIIIIILIIIVVVVVVVVVIIIISIIIIIVFIAEVIGLRL